MAAKQRSIARTELNRRIGMRSPSEFTNSDLDTWLNDALVDMTTRRIQLRSLERVGTAITSVIDQPSYAIPVGAFSMLYLEDTVNKKMLTRFVGTFEEYLKAKQNEAPTVTTIPAQFVEYGPSFYIFETPKVNTISWTPYFYARPTWAASDVAVPDIEEEWHKPIVILAAKQAFKDIGDEERSTLANGEWNEWLAQRDTPTRMTNRFNVPTRPIRPHGAAHNRVTGV